MDQYGPLAQNDGAEIRETSYDEKAQYEAEEDYSCDDLPEKRLCEDTTKYDNESQITIRKLSSYENGEISLTPEALSLKPGSHLTEEGNDHRISAGFVAKISGLDVQTVLSRTKAEPYFLKLDYNLTGHDLPRFTSRFLVVKDQEEEISLSGGLGSALRILKYVKASDSGPARALQRRNLPPPRRKSFLDQLRAAKCTPSKIGRPRSRHQTLASRHAQWSPRLHQHPDDSTQFLRPLTPLLRSLPSLGDQDDRMSECTDYTEDPMETPPLTLATTETNSLGGISELPGILDNSYEEFLHADSSLGQGNHEWSPCHAKGRQLPREGFEQQKRKARAMHAYNGDTTGMVSLMTMATTGAFDSLGGASYSGKRN
ncbi:hypothetical protein V8F20_002204 [Naviculisporaceae sp. PSN 640]